MELRITENITDTAAGAAGAAVSRGTLGTFTLLHHVTGKIVTLARKWKQF